MPTAILSNVTAEAFSLVCDTGKREGVFSRTPHEVVAIMNTNKTIIVRFMVSTSIQGTHIVSLRLLRPVRSVLAAIERAGFNRNYHTVLPKPAYAHAVELLSD
jgi:hypothetical protein